MKLGTDAVLLGAWAEPNKGDRILDVGGGTGIVSLMIAQRYSDTEIYTVEINKDTFIDLQTNIEKSPWNNRITVIQSDFNSYNFSDKFDLVISNPPFFDADLSNINAGRKLARQKEALNPQQLCRKASEILKQNSSLIIIYPFSSRGEFIKEALLNGFYLWKELKIRDKLSLDFKRSILHFKNVKQNNIIQKELCIKNNNGTYTEEFKNLTKEFYL